MGAGSSSDAIVDLARRSDPPEFWTCWQLSVVAEDGRELDHASITAFDASSGRMQLSGLSTPPIPNASYELRSDLDAPVVAIRYLLSLPLREPGATRGLALRHDPPGTKRGFITRSGAKTALVTTRGFGDVLEIGYQARPRIFDLTVRKPPRVLTATVVEIDERVTHDGRVLLAPIGAAIRQQLQSLVDAGIESVAVCLLHADRHAAHERLVGQIARDVGITEISLSHVVAPLPKFVARADTTAASTLI